MNIVFENIFLGQPTEFRERMAKRVEDFVYNLLVNVFNAENTASLGIEEIIKSGSYDPGPKVDRIEDPQEWTPEKIAQKAGNIVSDKGPEGDFDD